MTVGRRTADTPPRSRDARRPSFARNSRAFERVRAQGMPDARCTRSFACKKEKTHAHLQGPPKSHGIPCAMVLTAPPWSPWCTGLVSHHHFRELRPASYYFFKGTGQIDRFLITGTGD